LLLGEGEFPFRCQKELGRCLHTPGGNKMSRNLDENEVVIPSAAPYLSEEVALETPPVPPLGNRIPRQNATYPRPLSKRQPGSGRDRSVSLDWRIRRAVQGKRVLLRRLSTPVHPAPETFAGKRGIVRVGGDLAHFN